VCIGPPGRAGGGPAFFLRRLARVAILKLPGLVCYKRRKIFLGFDAFMMEDRILLWKFKGGSQDALRRIYEKYRTDLLKLAVALVTDVNTAEDVVQEVFVSFAQSAATIGLAGDLKKYLMTCVANRIRNRRRD
jgi:hypothetical protein